MLLLGSITGFMGICLDELTQGKQQSAFTTREYVECFLGFGFCEHDRIVGLHPICRRWNQYNHCSTSCIFNIQDRDNYNCLFLKMASHMLNNCR